MTAPPPWPWPEDSREDRIRRVGRSYRKVIRDIAMGQCTDPAGECHRLDMHWASYGVHWPVPRTAPEDTDSWVSAVEAALIADVKPSTIRKWAERGLIRVNTRQRHNRYNVGDLNELNSKRIHERRSKGAG